MVQLRLDTRQPLGEHFRIHRDPGGEHVHRMLKPRGDGGIRQHAHTVGHHFERGIERGEFRRVDTAAFVHFIVGPLIYAQVSDQSFGMVRAEARVLDERYLDALADHVLLSLTPR